MLPTDSSCIKVYIAQPPFLDLSDIFTDKVDNISIGLFLITLFFLLLFIVIGIVLVCIVVKSYRTQKICSAWRVIHGDKFESESCATESFILKPLGNLRPDLTSGNGEEMELKNCDKINSNFCSISM